MSDFDLYCKLGLLNDVVKALQGWPREMVTEREIATALCQPVSLIIKIFDTLGVVPRSWSHPELFSVEDIIESCTRHEVSWRANPVNSTSVPHRRG
jgi:hypothetical protein